MILVLASVYLKTGKDDEFLEVTKDLIEKTRLENGNISYDLCKDVNVDDLYVFIEKWENDEVLSAHMQTNHFVEFGDLISDLVAKDLEILKYEVIQ
ncbi:MAG: antibiotic biosynthesis monooxygenase [Methanobrevibacter sp.]|jgi:quinol monooxygenase YgiN|nr:antibiotic biosynthesis monooxygenase [Candidatus Methanoflexus mossambicus]